MSVDAPNGFNLNHLTTESTKIQSSEHLPGNFHTVSSKLGIYRSCQPNKEEFCELERQGFAGILNLRCQHNDMELLKGLRLVGYKLPIHIMTAADMVSALRIIKKAEKPFLFHSLRGTDRTGAIAVGCRIIFENWSLDDALLEFTMPDFGPHRLIYRNLPQIMRSFDWGEIKNQVDRDVFKPVK